MSELVHQDPKFSPKEVIAEAMHSTRLSIIVEGPNDVAWYREIEGKALKNVFFKDVGGCAKVVECFEYAESMSVRGVVFVVDKDLWVIYGVPEKYKSMVTTTGYSIENDMLKDSCVHRLFTEEQRQLIDAHKELLSRWFAFHAEELKDKKRGEWTHKYEGVENVITRVGDSLAFNAETLKRIRYVEPPRQIVERILSDFEMNFRGKSLLNLYAHVLKYKKAHLMDLAVKITPTPTQKALIERIRDAFSRQGCSV